MKIDFGTGKVYYPDSNEELKESLEEMKIKKILVLKLILKNQYFLRQDMKDFRMVDLNLCSIVVY